MSLSASQAATAVGKSVPTITRAIKNGKLSAEKLEKGGYKIDPAELFRVWPAITNESAQNPNILGHETPNESSVLQGEVEALRQQIATIEEERGRERSQLTETIDDLRRRLDAESAERRALTAQLTDQREKAPDLPKRRFWARMGG